MDRIGRLHYILGEHQSLSSNLGEAGEMTQFVQHKPLAPSEML